MVVSLTFELYGIPGGSRRVERMLAIEAGDTRRRNVTDPATLPEDVRAFL